MGKAKNALVAFIDDISDATLVSYQGRTPGTIHKDTNFRYDLQTVSPIEKKKKDSKGKEVTVKGKRYNLQIQVNKETTISTLKKAAPATVSGPVVIEIYDGETPPTAATIRADFLKKVLI